MNLIHGSEHTLTLIRHSKAEQPREDGPDHDRGLASRGRKDARAAGEWLSDPSHPVALELVLCSTAERARQTLDGLRAGGAVFSQTRFDERIYNAGAANLLEVLREVPDSVHAVLLVGHAPGVPVLASALAHHDPGSSEALERLSMGFPTSGLVHLGFDGSWAGLAPEAAHLLEFVVPRG